MSKEKISLFIDGIEYGEVHNAEGVPGYLRIEGAFKDKILGLKIDLSNDAFRKIEFRPNDSNASFQGRIIGIEFLKDTQKISIQTKYILTYEPER